MASSDVGQRRHPHITAAVDGSEGADTALRWAAREARRHGYALRVVHAWVPLPGGDGRTAEHGQARALLEEARTRALSCVPDLDVAVVDHLDIAGAALAAESETAAMLVLGSRGRGGFRSLLLGSTGLTAAAVSRCPVVVVHGPPAEAEGPVVVGADALRPAAAVLDFAFAEAAVHAGNALRVVYGWRPEAWASDGAGPVFTTADVQAAAERGLAEATAGRSADYPHVRVSRELLPESPAGALVHASATAGLTVVGRRVTGTSLGLRLGPVAHAVLLHARGPVAVVPYE